MYNPSRGGVRGGADQFTWESVKTDKHRENYLGHSLKAPVGRWQKGKDLSWYAKERKDDEDTLKTEKSEMAAIKRAEEEAMLIALGHNVVRKESQDLTKEEMTEALKRNARGKDELNIERVDGVGSTRRAALLTGIDKNSSSKNDGVVFECHRDKNSNGENIKEGSPSSKRSKHKKKLKKHKKEKKSRRNHNSSHSDESLSEPAARKSHKKPKRDYYSSQNSSKSRHKKKSRKEHKDSSGSDSDHYRSGGKNKTHKQHRTRNDSLQPYKRQRHDTSESD